MSEPRHVFLRRVQKRYLLVHAITSADFKRLHHIATETKAAEARIAVLEKVLKPFARFAERFGETARDDSWILTRNPSGYGNLTMGDVRRARSALAHPGTQEKA